MKCTNVGYILGAMVVLCAGGKPLLAATKTDPASLLKSAIEAIQHEETSIACVAASGIAKDEAWDQQRQKFLPLTERHMAGVYENFPGGKRRIECTDALVRWIGGPSPFIKTKYTAVYDGEISTVLTVQNGDFTQPGKVLDAAVSPSCTYQIVDAARATGWAFSIFGVRDLQVGSTFKPQRFSSFLSDAVNHGTAIAQSVTRNDEELLMIETKTEPQKKDVFWLDPKRGFSIVQFEHQIELSPGSAGDQPSYVCLYRWEVAEFFALQGGIFYPKRIAEKLADIHTTPAGVGRTGDITVAEVHLNDAKVNADTYTLKLPVGARLTDPVTGNRITIKGTPEEQASQIESQVKAAKQMLANPTSQPIQ